MQFSKVKFYVGKWIFVYILVIKLKSLYFFMIFLDDFKITLYFETIFVFSQLRDQVKLNQYPF